MRIHTLLAVTIFIFSLVMGAVRADVWSEAEKQIVYLDPGAFNELPSEIVEELKAQECTVPQVYGNSKSHNVIRGSFARNGQKDWAVLCSRNGVSSIKVFWGSATKCSSEIAESLNKSWLQGVGNNKIGYSRAIEPVSKESILKFYKDYGGPTPPATSHHGISDYFVGKASVVHYCSNGKWVVLTGAD